MQDDLNSTINEASSTLEKESVGIARQRRRRAGIGHWRVLALGVLLVAAWVGFHENALKHSQLITQREIRTGMEDVFTEVATYVDDYYAREGVLPETQPYSYLAYVVHYQVTGPRQYTLSFTLDGVTTTYTYEV